LRHRWSLRQQAATPLQHAPCTCQGAVATRAATQVLLKFKITLQENTMLVCDVANGI